MSYKVRVFGKRELSYYLAYLNDEQSELYHSDKVQNAIDSSYAFAIDLDNERDDEPVFIYFVCPSKDEIITICIDVGSDLTNSPKILNDKLMSAILNQLRFSVYTLGRETFKLFMEVSDDYQTFSEEKQEPLIRANETLNKTLKIGEPLQLHSTYYELDENGSVPDLIFIVLKEFNLLDTWNRFIENHDIQPHGEFYKEFVNYLITEKLVSDQLNKDKYILQLDVYVESIAARDYNGREVYVELI